MNVVLQTIVISSNNRRQHRKIVWQNAEFRNVTGGSAHSYHLVLKAHM